MNQSNEKRPLADVAVVLVHGIGDIESGEALEAATESIQRALPDRCVIQDGTINQRASKATEAAQANISSRRLHWEDREIELVEFHWAETFENIRLLKPVRAIRKLRKILTDVPRLGMSVNPSPGRVAVVRRIQTIQWVILILATGANLIGATQPYFCCADHKAQRQSVAPSVDSLLTVEGTGSSKATESDPGPDRVENTTQDETPNIRGLIEAGFWGTGILLGTYILGSTLVFWCLVATALFGGTSAFARSEKGRFWGTASLGFALTGAVIGFQAIAAFAIASIPLGTVPVNREDLQLLWIGLAISVAIFLFVAAALFNLLKDVTDYLAPDSQGNPTSHQLRIRGALQQLLDKLQPLLKDDGRLILVAHSLGTVIVTDAIREQNGSWSTDGKDGREAGVAVDLVTAGSPLRRSILRFLPDRPESVQALREELASTRPLHVDRWFNAYRLLDYVGQALSCSALLRYLRPSSTTSDGAISEHPLEPWYSGRPTHSNYWGDPRFLRFIAEEVIASGTRQA